MSFDARRLHGEDYAETGDINGRWGLAKPLPAPFRWRLRDAWRVLKGEAEIIVWPDTEEGKP